MRESKLPVIMMKTIDVYTTWQLYTKHIPKMTRYSLGVKIESLISDVLQMIASAQYNKDTKQLAYIEAAIAKNDVLKCMLYVLLKTAGIEPKHFFELTEKTEEVGKILYGWKNNATKKLGPSPS